MVVVIRVSLFTDPRSVGNGRRQIQGRIQTLYLVLIPESCRENDIGQLEKV